MGQKKNYFRSIKVNKQRGQKFQSPHACNTRLEFPKNVSFFCEAASPKHRNNVLTFANENKNKPLEKNGLF